MHFNCFFHRPQEGVVRGFMLIDAELNSEPLIDGDSMDLRHMSGIPKLTEAEH